MARQISLFALAAAVAFGAAACTPAAEKEPESTTTIVEREVQTPPVVVEREVQTPPPVIIETDRDRRDGDTTTVRAGENGLEVETTNR